MKKRYASVLSKSKNKKAQVTVFVIIAIVIVVVGVLFYTLIPNLRGVASTAAENPKRFITDCLSDEFDLQTQTIALQGGVLDPGFSYRFESNNVTYHCYTSTYYSACQMQIVFPKDRMQKDLLTAMEPKITECFDSLKKTLEDKGYTVTYKRGQHKLNILMDSIVLTMDDEVVISKKESNSFKTFEITKKSYMNELLNAAEDIVLFERAFGDADTKGVMSQYKDLRVEKFKQMDETTIYKLTQKDTGEVFQLASRSYAFA